MKVVNSNIRNFGDPNGGFGLGLGSATRACLVLGNTIYDPRPNDAIYSVFAKFSATTGAESCHIFANNFLKANVNNLPSPRLPTDPSPLHLSIDDGQQRDPPPRHGPLIATLTAPSPSATLPRPFSVPNPRAEAARHGCPVEVEPLHAGPDGVPGLPPLE